MECAFGIMANKWRISHWPLKVSTDLAIDVVKSCCLLRNFIHQEEGIINNLANNLFTPEFNSNLREIPRSNSGKGGLTANMII